MSQREGWTEGHAGDGLRAVDEEKVFVVAAQDVTFRGVKRRGGEGLVTEKNKCLVWAQERERKKHKRTTDSFLFLTESLQGAQGSCRIDVKQVAAELSESRLGEA